MKNTTLHEGELLKNYLKGSGNSMESYYKVLGMTKQNLYYHLKKAELDGDFLRLLKEKTGIDFTKVKEERTLSTSLSAKESSSKQVIPLGKHRPLRLKPEEYAEAFGDWQGLPMYNTPVTATFVATYRDDKMYKPQYYLHDPRFRDCDFGAVITGDSMHSEIRHGDFIACKEITDRRFIVYGDIYYVVATNGLETCKYLNADKSNPDNYMLIAKNEHISPAPIPKDMILKLYKVRGIIRGY